MVQQLAIQFSALTRLANDPNNILPFKAPCPQGEGNVVINCISSPKLHHLDCFLAIGLILE